MQTFDETIESLFDLFASAIIDGRSGGDCALEFAPRYGHHSIESFGHSWQIFKATVFGHNADQVERQVTQLQRRLA